MPSPATARTPWGPQRPDAQAALASPKPTFERPSATPQPSPATQSRQTGETAVQDASNHSDDEPPDPPARNRDQPTIGKTSIPRPNVPPSIRKQPTLPTALLTERERERERDRDSRDQTAPNEDNSQIDENTQPLFRHQSVDEDGDDALPPPLSARQAEAEAAAAAMTANTAQADEVFGEEVPLTYGANAGTAGEANHAFSGEFDQAMPSLDTISTQTRQFSVSKHRRSRREQDRMDLDDSGDEVADLLGASKVRVRKTQRPPAQIADGYRGRAGGAGPPGMRDKTSRDSSAQGDSDIDEDEVDEESQLHAKGAAGPSKPTIQKSQVTGPNESDDDDDDDDVIIVTTVRAGASPVKVRSKEEKEAEREARRKAKELEREKRASKKKRPLPTFRYQEAEEDIELQAAYNARASRLGGLPLDKEPISWEMVESFEAPKGRGKRPDWNTVKFWPYHLPFPGRRKGEAIVAVAGGCNIRCFRLSEERGNSEIWNAVDDSANWEREVCYRLASRTFALGPC